MELKSYFSIIKKHQGLFFAIITIVIFLSAAYFFFLPTTYDTSLFLNVTRSGSQISNEYKYDDFYRLQADEKFAETVVQWLRNPRIVTDISFESGSDVKELNLKQLTRVFQVEKLSSQVVSVKFSVPNRLMAEKTAMAISKVLEKNTKWLNEDQKEDNWFEIKADNPIIIKNNSNYGLIFLIALFVGIFSGFWVVMFRHYLE